MQLFFSKDINYDIAFLDKTESFHAAKVMRMRKGDEIYLTDGIGTIAKGVLIAAHPDDCEVRIIERSQSFKDSKYFLHIAMALPKNPERFEWFVEKATELGIDEITPVICSRSNRDHIRSERIYKVIVSAAKQAKQAFFPKLNEAIGLDEFTTIPFDGKKIIAHCEQGHKTQLSELIVKGNRSLVLIGPEGDFTDEEILLTSVSGFEQCSLGESILRTETAGVFVCSAFRFVNL